MADTGRAAGSRRSVGMRALAAAAALMAVTSLSTGCSSGKELAYQPRRMDPDPAREKSRETAQRLLGLTGVKGTVSDTGVDVSRCAEYGKDLFSTSHPWTVSGLTDADVDAGLAHLRTALPEHGWKVDGGGAQGPQVRAAHRADGYDLTVTGAKSAGQGKAALTFSVVSACYRATSQKSLDGPF
ncbi:hypothetical protein ACFV7Q_33900 [Streptomyces sp. NPDC059851]|uniref:hypothetical protein n=1 Tax=Streptomyces sp. NPDC059851 TaxID=3346971 RepID=UPI00365B0018